MVSQDIQSSKTWSKNETMRKYIDNLLIWIPYEHYLIIWTIIIILNNLFQQCAILFSFYFKHNIQISINYDHIYLPCNKVGHLFWFTILAQHETDDVILYIHSVHKHRGNSFKLQNCKMRLKQIRLNWINSMQVKKILFTDVFFSWSLCLLNMF